MPIIVQGLAGEEMYGADFAKHPPTWAVRTENNVLVVISNVFGPRIRGPA